MLAVISPAKTLDFESVCPALPTTIPDFLNRSSELASVLRKKSRKQLEELMSISPALAEVNFHRFQEWKVPYSADTARGALFAFKGDVYTGFDLGTYRKTDFQFAQRHLRILSGLYGILRPLDLILPYRLEMGTALKTPKGKTLYEFWGTTLTDSLNVALAESGNKTLVNLASHEYFKAVSPSRIRGRVVTPQFKDMKNGQYKIISFFAKKARGMMCDFMIRHRITTAESLLDFNEDGYYFNPAMSDADTWTFTRG